MLCIGILPYNWIDLSTYTNIVFMKILPGIPNKFDYFRRTYLTPGVNGQTPCFSLARLRSRRMIWPAPDSSCIYLGSIKAGLCPDLVRDFLS